MKNRIADILIWLVWPVVVILWLLSLAGCRTRKDAMSDRHRVRVDSVVTETRSEQHTTLIRDTFVLDRHTIAITEIEPVDGQDVRLTIDEHGRLNFDGKAKRIKQTVEADEHQEAGHVADSTYQADSGKKAAVKREDEKRHREVHKEIEPMPWWKMYAGYASLACVALIVIGVVCRRKAITKWVRQKMC